jgi:hypothetical protein
MHSATKKPLWVEGSPYGTKGQLCLVGLMLRAMSKPWVEASTQLDRINGRRHQHVTIVCMPRPALSIMSMRKDIDMLLRDELVGSVELNRCTVP